MKYEKRIYLSLFWIVLGLALIICRLIGVLQSDIWQGLGFGWLACGIVQTLRQFRYRTDKDYREKFDIELIDERNRYIATKAWSWAGYGFVLIAGIASIVFLIFRQQLIAQITCYSICLIVFLYWISYLCLKKKM